MKKVLWFDTETTGLDAEKNDIIQFAAMVEIDKIIVDEFQIKMQPIDYENISPKALEVHGNTIEDLKSFIPAKDGYREIYLFLNKHIDRFNKTDKFLSAGQNVRFDIDFLRANFIKNNNNYFGAYFDYHFLDLQSVTALAVRNGLINPMSYKLVDVAFCVGVSLENAHDAIADIKATREVFLKLEKMIFNS